MMRIDKRILIPGMVFAGVLSVQALSVVFSSNAPGADWAVTNNWQNNALPGPGDLVFIRGGRSPSVTSDVGHITRFYLGDSSAYGYTGTLTIATGGKLVTDQETYVGRTSTANAVGWLYVTGGSLQVGDTNGNLAVAVGTEVAGKPLEGTVVISGGTVRGCFLVGSSGIAGALPDLLQINGGAASIGCTSNAPSGFYGLEVRQSGTVKWVFDAAGVACLDYQGVRGKFDQQPTLVVDMAEYRGGPQTFTLLDCVSFDTTPSIVLTNCMAGTTYDWNTASGDFTVTTTRSYSTGTIIRID